MAKLRCLDDLYLVLLRYSVQFGWRAKFNTSIWMWLFCAFHTLNRFASNALQWAVDTNETGTFIKWHVSICLAEFPRKAVKLILNWWNSCNSNLIINCSTALATGSKWNSVEISISIIHYYQCAELHAMCLLKCDYCIMSCSRSCRMHINCTYSKCWNIECVHGIGHIEHM